MKLIKAIEEVSSIEAIITALTESKDGWLEAEGAGNTVLIDVVNALAKYEITPSETKSEVNGSFRIAAVCYNQTIEELKKIIEAADKKPSDELIAEFRKAKIAADQAKDVLEGLKPSLQKYALTQGTVKFMNSTAEYGLSITTSVVPQYDEEALIKFMENKDPDNTTGWKTVKVNVKAVDEKILEGFVKEPRKSYTYKTV